MSHWKWQIYIDEGLRFLDLSVMIGKMAEMINFPHNVFNNDEFTAMNLSKILLLISLEAHCYKKKIWEFSLIHLSLSSKIKKKNSYFQFFQSFIKFNNLVLFICFFFGGGVLEKKTSKNNWLKSIQSNGPKTPNTKQTEAEKKKKTHIKQKSN